jgi:hypothetical protein
MLALALLGCAVPLPAVVAVRAAAAAPPPPAGVETGEEEAAAPGETGEAAAPRLGAASRPFPFLYDVGGGSPNSTQWAHTLVPRVQLGKIFECPHPCGLLPSFDASTGAAVNGGIPQSPDFNMTLHLATLQQTFDRGNTLHRSKAVPDDDDRLIDLDFESWNPTWAQNDNSSYTHNASIALVRALHPGWTDAPKIEAEARQQFEAAALRLLVATAQAVRRLRPKLKIGFCKC